VILGKFKKNGRVIVLPAMAGAVIGAPVIGKIPKMAG
jgi:hypothetical protein